MGKMADNSCKEKSNKVESKVEVWPMCNENRDIDDCA